MLSRVFLLTFFVSVFPCVLFAQGFYGMSITERERDSLEALLKTSLTEDARFEVLFRLAAFHSFRSGVKDSVKAAQHLDELKKIAFSSGDSLKIAVYRTAMSSHLFSNGYMRTLQTDKDALKFAIDAERLYARMLERGELSAVNLEEYVHVLNFCARLLNETGRHEEAYSYVYRSLNISKVRKLELHQLHASIDLGNIHYNLMNYEEAATYYMRAAEIAQKLNSNMTVTLQLNMGLVNVAQGNYDKGIEYLKQAYEQLEKRKHEFGVGDYRVGKATYLNNLVSALLDAGRLAEAVKYNQLLLEWADSLNDPVHKRKAEALQIILLLKENRLNAAIEAEKEWLGRPGVTAKIRHKLDYAFADFYSGVGLHREAIQRMKSMDVEVLDVGLKIKVYRALADAYFQIGDVDSAYKYLLAFVVLQEALNKSIQNRRTQELAFQYEVDKVNEQLRLADREIVGTKKRLRRQYVYTTLIALSLGLFVFLAWAFWRGRSKLAQALAKLKKQNQEIIEQGEELAVQSRRLAEALAAKNELDAFKESMLQLIVHDLKNPLNIVLGFSEIGEMDESVRQPIRAAGFRMLTLVNTMLDVSKLESAALVPNLKPIRVADWVKSAYEQVKHDAENKQIRFLSDVRQDIWINADEDLAVRILVNLFTNAVKYCRTGGQISISAGLDPDNKKRVRVHVSDTGEGIAPEFLPFVFKRYSTNAPKSMGLNRSTGLGLYFCKLAVEAHGGKIDVKSRPGHGTSFVFDLPLAEVRESEAAKTGADSLLVKPEIQAALNLSHQDKQALKHHVHLLSELEVYETTNILTLLESVPSDSETVKTWKKEVRKAVFACNAVRYAMLLRKAEI